MIDTKDLPTLMAKIGKSRLWSVFDFFSLDAITSSTLPKHYREDGISLREITRESEESAQLLISLDPVALKDGSVLRRDLYQLLRLLSPRSTSQSFLQKLFHIEPKVVETLTLRAYISPGSFARFIEWYEENHRPTKFSLSARERAKAREYVLKSTWLTLHNYATVSSGNSTGKIVVTFGINVLPLGNNFYAVLQFLNKLGWD